MRLAALVGTSEGALLPVGELAADPDVTAVVTTDLLDPRRYLTGGELVLTGLAWWRPQRPGRSRGFVAALVSAGVAALAAGEAEYGAVPDDLVDACAEAGLPLLRVPVTHSFATITERVNRQLSGGGELATVLARHRALVAAVAAGPGAGGGLVGVLDLVAADLGAGLAVLAPTGRLIASAGALQLSDADRRRYARVALGSARPTRPGVTLVPTGEPRVESWLLVIDGDESGWPDQRRAVIQELAALVALERALAGRRSDAADQLAVALTGDSADAVRQSGINLAEAAVVVVASGRFASTVLTEAGLGPGLAGTTAIAVVPGGDPVAVVAHLRGIVTDLAPGLGAEPLRIGVSDAVTGAAGLLAATAEARAAAAAVEGNHGVAGPERLSSHTVLLAAVPAELRQAYRRRVLGPLLEHDQLHRTELVRTLAAYLDCSGSWSRCAALMHLHVNTLRYRIERIEALTGRDLRSLADQADLLLALHLPDPQRGQE